MLGLHDAEESGGGSKSTDDYYNMVFPPWQTQLVDDHAAGFCLLPEPLLKFAALQDAYLTERHAMLETKNISQHIAEILHAARAGIGVWPGARLLHDRMLIVGARYIFHGSFPRVGRSLVLLALCWNSWFQTVGILTNGILRSKDP